MDVSWGKSWDECQFVCDHIIAYCLVWTLRDLSKNRWTRYREGGGVRSAASVSVGMFGPGRKQVIAEYLLFRWRCEVRRLCLATHHLPAPWSLFTGDPGSASSSRPQSYYTHGLPFLKHCIFLWLHFLSAPFCTSQVFGFCQLRTLQFISQITNLRPFVREQ